MRLEKASHKAIKYACMNFHYAKSVPVNVFGYSVFNDKNEWCGVVLFGLGANKNMPKRYELNQGQCAELVRMALNGKQEKTSKVMSMAIKLFKKDNPLIKLIVSYADTSQNHTGTIYQATNWFYDDFSKGDSMIVDGKQIHKKSLYSKYGNSSLVQLQNLGFKVEKSNKYIKHRYIYPLDKSLIPLCRSLSKPYPKHAAVAHLGEQLTTSQEGAFDATLPLNNSVKTS